MIEDDSEIRNIVTFILEQEGFEVAAAEPWPADRLKHMVADLIILDEWVNEQEGHELCLELKKIHETMHIPVIIFSTKPNIADIARDCKAEGYVRKPFELEEFMTEIENCFSGHYRLYDGKLRA